MGATAEPMPGSGLQQYILMNSVNHLMIFAQPDFVDAQVRRALREASRPSPLRRVWRRLGRYV